MLFRCARGAGNVRPVQTSGAVVP